MWVEVSVPYVDAVMENPPPRSNFYQYRVEHGLPLRFYYSQILWVDQLRTDGVGQVWYRINERYGNPGDILWAVAEAFRPLTEEELSPINPEVEDKRILVKVLWEQQMLSCYEGDREVYYCRVSSGVASGSTPLSAIGSKGFAIWRKLHSLHMSGGTNTEGWDLPGIRWTELFSWGRRRFIRLFGIIISVSPRRMAASTPPLKTPSGSSAGRSLGFRCIQATAMLRSQKELSTSHIRNED
jgi:hypothetical protein